jgi:hypothetical protein
MILYHPRAFLLDEKLGYLEKLKLSSSGSYQYKQLKINL